MRWKWTHCRIPRVLTTVVVSILILVALNAVQIRNSEESSTYIAAVVEYKPSRIPWRPWESPARELILKNVQNYVELIKEAAALNADIIVFPEYGITTLEMPRNRTAARPFLLEIPGIGRNPCKELACNHNQEENDVEDPDDPLQLLSCAAQQNSIYVVVNLGEILPCNSRETANCPGDGAFQYNTNVVFDREGAIAAKYRKTHLYFETQFDRPPLPEYSIFKTDFGVIFGQFICYDIIFHDPAVKLIERGVRNIIYTSAWVDELPFLTAPQSHASWAASARVNLLASGYHQPHGGQLGSGIYSSVHGALNYTFDPDSGTRLVLAKVPKVPYSDADEQLLQKSKFLNFRPTPKRTHSFELATIHTYLKENLTNYWSKILDTNAEIVCDHDFCCSAHVRMSRNYSRSENTSIYRVIAFNGIRKTAQETAEFGWQVCALVRCVNSSLESCSIRDDDSDQVNRIAELELRSGPFRMDEDVMQPSLNTIDTNFDIIPFGAFKVEIIDEGEGESEVTVHSNELAAFSIQTISIIKRTY